MPKDQINPEALIKIYADAALHADRIIWSQVTTLMGIEALAVAGGFGKQGTVWAPTILFVGVLLIIMIYLFIHKTRLDREHISIVLNKLLLKYSDEDLRSTVLAFDKPPKMRGTEFTGGKHGSRASLRPCRKYLFAHVRTIQQLPSHYRCNPKKNR